MTRRAFLLGATAAITAGCGSGYALRDYRCIDVGAKRALGLDNAGNLYLESAGPEASFIVERWNSSTLTPISLPAGQRVQAVQGNGILLTTSGYVSPAGVYADVPMPDFSQLALNISVSTLLNYKIEQRTLLGAYAGIATYLSPVFFRTLYIPFVIRGSQMFSLQHFVGPNKRFQLFEDGRIFYEDDFKVRDENQNPIDHLCNTYPLFDRRLFDNGNFYGFTQEKDLFRGTIQAAEDLGNQGTPVYLNANIDLCYPPLGVHLYQGDRFSLREKLPAEVSTVEVAGFNDQAQVLINTDTGRAFLLTDQ